MRALPLHQPFATLIAIGAKSYETRHWQAPPSLIGERIAIYATKSREDLLCATMPHFTTALVRESLPLGAIVATAVVTSSVEMDRALIASVSAPEHAFGTWALHRFAWRLEHVDRLETPIPWTWPARGPRKFVPVEPELAQLLLRRITR